jgi:hypothetical protein
MAHLNITHERLLNQRIAEDRLETPEGVVACLGAVQAQDYAGAKWALGLRMQNGTDNVIERAFTDGTILRTHVMRPTWHFVTPADIRWLLALTAPRVNALNAHYYHLLELDDAIFKRSNAALVKACKAAINLPARNSRLSFKKRALRRKIYSDAPISSCAPNWTALSVVGRGVVNNLPICCSMNARHK